MWWQQTNESKRDINFSNEETCHITFVFINPSALFIDDELIRVCAVTGRITNYFLYSGEKGFD